MTVSAEGETDVIIMNHSVGVRLPSGKCVSSLHLSIKTFVEYCRDATDCLMMHNVAVKQFCVRKRGLKGVLECLEKSDSA